MCIGVSPDFPRRADRSLAIVAPGGCPPIPSGASAIGIGLVEARKNQGPARRVEQNNSVGGSIMRKSLNVALGIAVAAGLALANQPGRAQQPYGPNDAPNPYKFNYGWAKLPDSRKWGAAVGVDMDRDGKSVWVFDRCESATDCSKSK